jgi:hypothetical protein
VGNRSEKPPTSREHDVLTGVLSPSHLESGLHAINLGPHIVNSVRRLHLKRDYLAVKRGPNLVPRQSDRRWTGDQQRGRRGAPRLEGRGRRRRWIASGRRGRGSHRLGLVEEAVGVVVGMKKEDEAGWEEKGV